MEAHARSLLERLNTASSPKPLSKSATPEPIPLASPFAVDTRKELSLDTPISTESRSANRDVLDGPEATMSVKDLLVSARHRSREQSVEANPRLADNSAANDTHHTDPEAKQSEPPTNAPRIKENHGAGLNTSDGDSSANPEDLPTTPSASNNSSVVSNGAEISHNGTVNTNSPQGLRIVNNIPSIVTLPQMKSHIPRLQFNSDASGHTFPGEGIEQIANLARSFGHYDRDVIGATTKYIVYALKDGRIRIIDQNTGTRAIAETQSTAPVISLFIQDGQDSEESFVLVLDTSHDLTIWSIKPWKIDSADVPLDYSIRIQTTGRNADQSFPPIAKWWPRYSNCLAVCTGLAVCIYVFSDAQSGQTINISKDNDHAISIPVETGVRDFSFSADGSALAVVDFHGDILLWSLCSDATFSEFYDTSRLKSKLVLSKPTLKYALPKELNPCSVQFLETGDGSNGSNVASSTPLLLVGSSYNRHLHLIDIGRGALLQEIVLPSIDSESMPAQNFSMAYTKERNFLTVGDTISDSIFFFHLQTAGLKIAPTETQSDYLINIADRENSRFSDGILPAFDYVTTVPFFPHHRLQSLAVTPSMDAALDVFTAHSNGFTMLSPNHEDILPANYMEAKVAATKSISKPELLLEVDVRARRTGNRTPSLKSLSTRSSSESVRSVRGAKQTLLKKDSSESLRGRSPVARAQLKSIETTGTKNNNSNITTEVSSPVRNTSDKPQSPPSIPQAQGHLETQIEPSPVGFQDILNQALEQQYQRFSAEQRHLTVAADDRHESILKVVSSTLTTNVGKLLEQTVRASIEKSILPVITSTVKESVDEQLATLLTPLEKTVAKEVRSTVDKALIRILKGNDNSKLIDTISETVAVRLGPAVGKEISARLETLLEKNIAPLISEMEKGIEASMQQTQRENLRFQAETVKKLDGLTEAIAGITTQLKVDKNGLAQVDSPIRTDMPPVARSKLEMNEYFKAGKYSSGIEIWSDSSESEQAALFEVCLDYDPSILKGLEQLSLMSALNAISIDFKTHLEMRLVWLEKIITLVRREGRYTEYWPRVLNLLDQRLDTTYGEMSSKDHKGSLARKVAVTQYYTQGKLKEIKQ